MNALFSNLPEFPPSLKDDELRFLASLPDWPTNQEVYDSEARVCGRLERMGLVKVSRQKDDPAAMFPTLYAGKLIQAKVRAA